MKTSNYQNSILALERQFVDLSESEVELSRRIAFLKKYSNPTALKISALEAMHEHIKVQLEEMAETIANSRIELIQISGEKHD